MILRHSGDVQTVLSRKIITKDIIFQYLDKKGIPIVEPSTKPNLIIHLIKYWEYCRKKIIPQDNPQDKVKELANRFSEWFYNIMNEERPIGEEHFFQECVLNLQLISVENNVSECVENNPREVSELIFKTKHDHQLFFNPNLSSDGIKAKMDAHGLVLVFACGTLHTKDSIVGIFEQMFALARDPFSENNWKIKNTTLILRSKPVRNVPVLVENPHTNNYEVQLREN